MTETLARKRMHIGALVALAALAVALFAVFQSAQADEHEHLVLSVGDSDNIIKADANYTLTVTVMNMPAPDGGTAIAASDYSYRFVAIPGAFPRTASNDAPADFEADADTPAADAVDAENQFYVPAGVEGEYTISVGVFRNNTQDADGTIEGQKSLSGTLTVTVGDAGTPIGSATISLGKVGHATAKTISSDSAQTAAGTVPTGAEAYDTCADDPAVANNDLDGNGTLDDPEPIDAVCIALTVAVQNSLGNKANGSDVSAVHIFAPLATIIADNDNANLNSGNDNFNGTAQLPGDRNAVQFFVASSVARTVNVNAIIIGATGSTTSESFELTFTGAADVISVGEPDSALAQTGTAAKDAVEADDTTTPPTEAADAVESSGEARILVTAVDKAGNVATLSPDDISVEVVDADDALTTKIVSTETQHVNAAGTTLPTTVRITLRGEGAAPGEYTVKVTYGDNDPETATVVVAAKVANVALEVSESTVAIGDIVTVTATVTDADGNLSPDVGAVAFQAVGALNLSALGAGASEGSVSVDLDDGTAEARFVVVSGSGTATIIATTGGVDGVTSVSTAVADDEADEPAGPSLSDFSRQSGVAAYTGPDATASELLALLVGRATIIWLSDGDNWTAYYALIDGSEAPGSSNFTVTSGDVLYIGN